MSEVATPATPVAETSTEAPALTSLGRPIPPEQTALPTTPTPSDTPSTPTPEPEAPDAEQDDGFNDFLKEAGIEVPAAEAATGETAPEAVKLPSTPEELEQVVSQRLAEIGQTAQKTQQTQAQIEAFRGTRQSIYDSLIADGMPPGRAQQYAATFESYANSVAPVHRTEAQNEENLRVVQTFYNEMAKSLSPTDAAKFIAARGADHKSEADTVTAFQALARKGYVKESEAKNRETTAVVAKLKELDEKGLLNRSRTPSTNDGRGMATIGRMNFKNLEEVEAAHVAGQIDTTARNRLFASGLQRRAG